MERATQIFTALLERLTLKMEDAMRAVQQSNPPPSSEEREVLIRDSYSHHIQEVQDEVLEEVHLDANIFGLAMERYLQYPSFKATVDRLREEQRMTFARLSQLYWPT